MAVRSAAIEQRSKPVIVGSQPLDVGILFILPPQMLLVKFGFLDFIVYTYVSVPVPTSVAYRCVLASYGLLKILYTEQRHSR